MARSMSRMGTWRGRSAAKKFRAAPAFETMETRALLASGALSTFSSLAIMPTRPTTTVITVTSTNNPLFNALKTFLMDLEATFGPNGTGSTAASTATLTADLNAISNLAGTSVSSTQAVQRLNSDVAAITTAGTITAPQKLTLLTDLESIAFNAGISGTQVISVANQVFGVGKTSLANGLAGSDLTNPNAINSAPAGQTRGQDTSSFSTLLSPGSSGSGLGAGGILGTNYRKLRQDLLSELAKSQAITSVQIVAIQRDFSEIATQSHRPAEEFLKALWADLDAAVTNGLTAASRIKLAKDMQLLLTSAGLSESVIARTLADFQPVLDASDLRASSIKTSLGDLASLLAARPKATLPLGSWFLGK